MTEARWSPDGTAIAYLSPGEADPDRTAVRNIYVASLESGEEGERIGETRQLTSDLAIRIAGLVALRKEIAFLGDDLSDDRATNTGVWVVRVADGRLVNLSADVDRPAGDYVTDDMNAEAGNPAPIWSRDGREIVGVIMSDRGRSVAAAFAFPGDAAYERGVARSHAEQMAADPWQGSQFGATPSNTAITASLPRIMMAPKRSSSPAAVLPARAISFSSRIRERDLGGAPPDRRQPGSAGREAPGHTGGDQLHRLRGTPHRGLAPPPGGR